MKYTIEQLKSVLKDPKTAVLLEFRDMAADFLDWKSNYNPSKFINESSESRISVAAVNPSFVWTVASTTDEHVNGVFDFHGDLVDNREWRKTLITGFHANDDNLDDLEVLGWFISSNPWDNYQEKELSLCLDCPTCAASGRVHKRDFEGKPWFDSCPDCEGSGTLATKIRYKRRRR